MDENAYKEIKDSLNKKVNWVAFAWAMGLLVTTIGISITYASTANVKADDTDDSLTLVRERVTAVETKQETQFDEIIRRLSAIDKKLE